MEDFDVSYDLIRSKRECGKLNNEWDDFKRLVDDKNTESNYQQFIRLLLDNAETHEHQKRKRDGIIFIDEEVCSDEENDPQYELFLRSLKEHGKSYVLESEKDGIPVFIKYEAENGSRNVSDQKSQQKMLTCAEQLEIAWFSQKSGPRNKWMGEHMCDHGDQAQLGEKDKFTSQIYLQQLDKGEDVANKRVMVNQRDRCQKNNWLKQCPNEQVYHAQPVVESEEQIDRKLKGKNVVQGEQVYHTRPVKESNRQIEIKLEGKNVVQGEQVCRARPVKEFKKQVDRKLKGKYVVQGEQVHHAQPVKESKKQIDRKLKGKNVVHGDNGLSNQKSPFGNYAVKSEPDDSMKIRLDVEGTPNKIKNVKVDNFPVIYNMSDENSPGKEDSNEIVAEVEILDNAALIEQGKFGPFVPSKRFHKSMMDDNYQDIGGSSASNEFRREVLKVISKPFDMEEYKRHTKTIEEGSYLDHYPDLGRKLKKHRYKREKRLVIFRGFFFWLQNLTREGAFQPWTDRQCLAVPLT